MSLQAKVFILILAAVALPILFWLLKVGYVKLVYYLNFGTLEEGSAILKELYRESELAEDEERVFELLKKKTVMVVAEDCSHVGYRHDGEDDLIVIPLTALVCGREMEPFIPIFLASELVFAVCRQEGLLEAGSVGVLLAHLRHWEMAIRCFIRLQRFEQHFASVPEEVLEDWLEEAYLYKEDKEAWAIRAQANIVHAHPDLTEAVAAINA